MARQGKGTEFQKRNIMPNVNDSLLFAADRMYDAIRSLLGASSPAEFGDAIAAQKVAADDYDRAIEGEDVWPGLAELVRRTVSLAPGRN